MSGGYIKYTPSRMERVWRRLGFRPVRKDLPDGIEKTHPGWMITTTRFRFSALDRIRLLVSGRLEINVRQATTKQVENTVNAVSHRILYPGEEW